MAAHPLSFMYDALKKLEAAVESAAVSIRTSQIQDKAILDRVSSYKEIIRRQHVLIAELRRASDREDWKEVSRLTSLVHGASLMIKVDAGFLVSRIKSKAAASSSSR